MTYKEEERTCKIAEKKFDFLTQFHAANYAKFKRKQEQSISELVKDLEDLKKALEDTNIEQQTEEVLQRIQKMLNEPLIFDSNMIEHKSNTIESVEKTSIFDEYKSELNSDAMELFDIALEHVVNERLEKREKPINPIINSTLNEEPSNIHILGRRVVGMKKQLSNCLPNCLVIYLIGSFATMALSFILFVLKYTYGIYITKDFYLISAFLISITLFLTALVAAADWKGTNKDEKKREK